MKNRTTLKDVAQKVGVTPATVSMVLSNKKNISQETRNKVLEAVKDLNYYPNRTARSLVKGKTETIAIMAEFFYPQFFQQLLSGIEHTVSTTNFSITHYSSLRREDNNHEIYQKILFGREADALITFDIVPDPEYIKLFKDFKIPLVTMESTIPEVLSVECDNLKGGYLAGRHMIEQGKKHLYCAFVPTDRAYSKTNVQQQRLEGFKWALKEASIDFTSENILDINHFSLNEGQALYKKIQGLEKIDGLFSAAGDSVAIGLMHFMKQDGLRIPEDIAIVGYDNLEFSAYCDPPLTTINQPGYMMGQGAARLILEQLTGNKTQIHEILRYTPELVIRKTT